jgi:hypothetical protein
MLFALLVGGLPLVAGMATPTVRQPATSSVVVSLFFDKETKSSSVIVTDEAKTKVYGHSCANTLALGSVNIAYDVDQYGSGKLQFGPKTYTIHSDATVSGGVKCGVIYDYAELHVDCLAPWTADSKFVELTTNTTLPCFHDHISRRNSYGLDETRNKHSVPRATHPEAPIELDSRQAGSIGGSTCNPYQVSKLVGNGNPHQNYRHTQISVSFHSQPYSGRSSH